jgi:hypothetical protein
MQTEVEQALKMSLLQNICLRQWAVSNIVVFMEAVCTSETSVCFNENTWHYIPEGCHHLLYGLGRNQAHIAH